MKVIAGVFARGGSKGVPDKNLRVLDGQTLVHHAVRQALACEGVDRVVVSTDSERIADEARTAGGEVPWMRPEHLSTDTAREWDAWRHMLDWLADRHESPDAMLVVPCTAPLRDIDDLQRCIDAARDPGLDAVITVSEAHRNPWFNMVRLDEQGHARLVLEPPERIYRRQDAPVVHDVGTVAFVVKPTYVMSATSLYDGVVGTVIVPVERSLDIDTEFDLQMAELVLARRRAGTAVPPGTAK